MSIFDKSKLVTADKPTHLMPNVVQLPTGGPIDSKAINSTMSRLLQRTHSVEASLDNIQSRFNQYKASIAQSSSWRQGIAEKYALELDFANAYKYIEQIDDINNPAAKFVQDFTVLGNITHRLESTVSPGNFITYPLARRARVDTVMNQATLPYSVATSLFHGRKVNTTEESYLLEANVIVTELTEEASLEVVSTSTANIYNGDSSSPYIIRAAYSLESGVTEVEFSVKIQVPQSLARQANVLRLYPSPEGQVDIVSIKYGATSDEPDTSLPGVTFPINQAVSQSFIFEPVYMTSVEVVLRCRKWVEENSCKVFYLGIQDLDIQFVEFDGSYNASVPGTAVNNGFFDIVEIKEIPGIFETDVIMDRITGVRTSPEFSDAAVGITGTNYGIRVLIYTDPELTNQVWDSLNDATPSEASPVDVSAASTNKLYVVVELDKLTSGITPVLKRVEIDYKVSV